MENQKTNRKNLARQESNSTNWIRTIAILSPVNPVGKELSEAECQELKKKFEYNLKIGHFPYFKSTDGFYTIYNIDFCVAKKKSMDNSADSFIFAKIHWNREGDAVFTLEYWEHFCKTINGIEQITTYKLKGSQELGGSFENDQAKDDFLARLNHPFKSFIPNDLVKQMAAVNNVVEDFARRNPNVDIFEFFNESISEMWTGKHHWITRAKLYKNWNTLKISDIAKNIHTYAIVPKDGGKWPKKPKNPILNAIKDIWPYTTVDKYFNCKKNTYFLIVNIPLDNIKRLAAKYKIDWFYYGYENVTDIWRIIDLKNTKSFSANDFKKFEYAEGITNYSGLPDGYWIKGWRSRVEFNIPFAAIDDISMKIQANIDKYFAGDDSIVDWCINHVGLAAHLRQKRLYQFD